MFATPDYEMIFLNNCEEKITITLNVCKKVKTKYEKLLKTKLSAEDRKEYEEKNEKNNKDIEYYESSIKYIRDRRVIVQKLIDNGNKY